MYNSRQLNSVLKLYFINHLMHLNTICIYLVINLACYSRKLAALQLKINCSVTSQMRFSFGKEKLHTH